MTSPIDIRALLPLFVFKYREKVHKFVHLETYLNALERNSEST